VNALYTGWILHGQQFDSSSKHGNQSFTFVIGQHSVISGWELGMVGMRVGGERRLIIPPALAYGAQGYPPTIPANATLVFDITVVSAS
jgi:FKBP-type peptidyl-prolyl cis-trans isomerase